jgi:hypothetical protein
MDAVLPLRLSGGYQDLSRARILLHSLEHFWADAVPLRLIVIAPAADVPAIRAGLRPRRLPLAVLREEVLLPGLADLPGVRGFFAVCQSSTGADPRAAWRQVAPFIPGSPF